MIESSSTEHNFQYDWGAWEDYSNDIDHLHQLDFPNSMGPWASVEHHIDGLEVVAQVQLDVQEQSKPMIVWLHLIKTSFDY